ncbi:hypothetical protein GQ457_09G005910 [Hibiscus cannabinus]
MCKPQLSYSVRVFKKKLSHVTHPYLHNNQQLHKFISPLSPLPYPSSLNNLCLQFSLMEQFRSKSYKDGGEMQMESYNGGGTRNMQDLRSYSANSAQQNQLGKEIKVKKSKSSFGSCSKSWSFTDPELQRKKRVASYKVYAVEGKMKGSLRKSFRWIKDTYTQVVYGCQ